MQWILIGGFVLLFALMMFFSNKRNKKSQESYMDMLNSLEKGDKVYLTSRIVGKIVKVVEEGDGAKYILVESGEGENKSNFLVDVQAVYSVLSKANAPVVKEEVKEESENNSTENAEDVEKVDETAQTVNK